MRKMLAVLVLGVAMVINATAFAGDYRDTRIFFGDGFDNTTCADTPRLHQCS